MRYARTSSGRECLARRCSFHVFHEMPRFNLECPFARIDRLDDSTGDVGISLCQSFKRIAMCLPADVVLDSFLTDEPLAYRAIEQCHFDKQRRREQFDLGDAVLVGIRRVVDLNHGDTRIQMPRSNV